MRYCRKTAQFGSNCRPVVLLERHMPTLSSSVVPAVAQKIVYSGIWERSSAKHIWQQIFSVIRLYCDKRFVLGLFRCFLFRTRVACFIS